MRSCELTAYVYVWENYRLLELPWDSAWTWWLSFLGVDLGYYWLHRMAHGSCTHTNAHDPLRITGGYEAGAEVLLLTRPRGNAQSNMAVAVGNVAR